MPFKEIKIGQKFRIIEDCDFGDQIFVRCGGKHDNTVHFDGQPDNLLWILPDETVVEIVE